MLENQVMSSIQEEMPTMTYDEFSRIKGLNDTDVYWEEWVPRRLEADEIATFEMLSQVHPADFAEMLGEAADLNYELVNSWPKQAELAAAGKWDELEKYKAELPEWNFSFH